VALLKWRFFRTVSYLQLHCLRPNISSAVGVQNTWSDSARCALSQMAPSFPIFKEDPHCFLLSSYKFCATVTATAAAPLNGFREGERPCPSTAVYGVSDGGDLALFVETKSSILAIVFLDADC